MGDFLMEGDRRLNHAKREKFQEETKPQIGQMMDRKDDLEGLERAGLLNDDSALELKAIRQFEAENQNSDTFGLTDAFNGKHGALIRSITQHPVQKPSEYLPPTIAAPDHGADVNLTLTRDAKGNRVYDPADGSADMSLNPPPLQPGKRLVSSLITPKDR